jgi:hypothetical protein
MLLSRLFIIFTKYVFVLFLLSFSFEFSSYLVSYFILVFKLNLITLSSVVTVNSLPCLLLLYSVCSFLLSILLSLYLQVS